MKTNKKRKRIKVITNTLTGRKKPKFENTKFEELENSFRNFFKMNEQFINI